MTAPPLSFVYAPRAVRILFGAGRLGALADEMRRLGSERVLVLSTPGRGATLSQVRELLGDLWAGAFTGAAMHVPRALLTEALATSRSLNADGYVTLGGGSAIGLGKALARETAHPLLAVPTTYSGSEMTAIWAVTERGSKRTGRDSRVAPRTVLYDPLLTVTLPPSVSGPSGLNAIAHCVEALYAVDGTPVTSMMAEEGIRRLAASLPRIMARPSDLRAREDALYGAHLAGWALDGVSMALHHKLCHTLGGRFGLPHALTHALMLPYTAAYNRDAAPDGMRRVAQALDSPDAVDGLFVLNDRLGIPLSLQSLGLREEQLDEAARLAVEAPYPNPRPVTRTEIYSLLTAAFHGRRPAAEQSR